MTEHLLELREPLNGIRDFQPWHAAMTEHLLDLSEAFAVQGERLGVFALQASEVPSLNLGVFVVGCEVDKAIVLNGCGALGVLHGGLLGEEYEVTPGEAYEPIPSVVRHERPVIDPHERAFHGPSPARVVPGDLNAGVVERRAVNLRPIERAIHLSQYSRPEGRTLRCERARPASKRLHSNFLQSQKEAF